MKVERKNTERPGQTDLYTACDNPACSHERYDGYTAPWAVYAGFGGLERDGWLPIMGVDACSWACLAIVAAAKAEEGE